MENLKSKAILLFESAHNFTTQLTDDEYENNKSMEWDVTYTPSLKKIYQEVVTIVKQLEDADNFFNDKRIKDLIIIGKELRKRLFRLQTIHKEVNEISATNMGGSSFNPGKGIQHTGKNAFKNKETKIPIRKLFNEEKTPNLDNFQKERIDAFDDITAKINNLSPLVSNAKTSTIEYYNNNPTSFELHISTEIILNYLNKIEQLLNPNK